jgi:hypothetical protein
LHCIVILPHYEDGTNTGTPAGQDGCQPRKTGTTLRELKAGQEHLREEMKADEKHT